MVELKPPSHSYLIPRAQRGKRSPFQLIHGIVMNTVFLGGCIILLTLQLLFFLPLRAIPSRRAHTMHYQGIRYTKGAFGQLVTLVSQVFAPTTLRVTFESEGPGAFTPEQVEKIVVKDANGAVTELRFPNKMVIISNHQNSVDWIYTWSLTYFMNMHRDVLIVLKDTLKWVPVLGWGMQMFRFIFLARSFASDKAYLVRKLSKVGARAEAEDSPLAFLIFPEGTVCDADGRGISKRYADKAGLTDMTHTLLPRSTGLLYSLRALSPRIRDLKLLDITVAYQGIPALGYGKDYFIIQSVFMDRVPPPKVHMHFRMFDVSSSVPIGDLSGASVTPPASATNVSKILGANGSARARNGSSSASVEVDVPESERLEFDGWLRELWTVKDQTIDAYHRSPTSSSGSSASDKGEYSTDNDAKFFASAFPAQEIPVKLRSPVEVFHAFGFFWPFIAFKAWKKIKSA